MDRHTEYASKYIKPLPKPQPNEEKEAWLQRMRELQREVTLDEIAEILGTTIKEDRENKLITFLYMLLNYTKENQQNIIFKAESSTGKTYIPTQIAQYFPKEDVKKLANCTRRAFYHEFGKYDKETHTKFINLHQKILVFQEQRDSELLKELRPLLSHDSKIIVSKITDRSRKYGHLTKTVALIGFPTVIFCSAGSHLQEQELTRCIVLSPEATREKLQASLELLHERLSNPIEFEKWLKEDKQREFLMSRIRGVKEARISHIVIPDELKLQIYDQFTEDHPYLSPRLQRDLPRVYALIKAHTLLNLFHREKKLDGTAYYLIADYIDAAEGYALYKYIAESNELGLTPETYEVWKSVIEPKIMEKTEPTGTFDEPKAKGLTKKEMSQTYFQHYHRNISKWRLKNLIDELLNAGLILEDKDPNDSRKYRYYPIEIK